MKIKKILVTVLPVVALVSGLVVYKNVTTVEFEGSKPGVAEYHIVNNIDEREDGTATVDVTTDEGDDFDVELDENGHVVSVESSVSEDITEVREEELNEEITEEDEDEEDLEEEELKDESEPIKSEPSKETCVVVLNCRGVLDNVSSDCASYLPGSGILAVVMVPYEEGTTAGSATTNALAKVGISGNLQGHYFQSLDNLSDNPGGSTRIKVVLSKDNYFVGRPGWQYNVNGGSFPTHDSFSEKLNPGDRVYWEYDAWNEKDLSE